MSHTTTEDRTTLPEALLPVIKDHCRVDFDDDDATLTRCIRWAIGYAQHRTGLQIFGAVVTWTPGSALSLYQCPVQPVSAFLVTSDAVDISADYALQASALTDPVWLVKSDGTSFAADANVTLMAGYEDPDDLDPALYGNIVRNAATLYEHRESVTTLSVDQMPSWFNDDLAGLWVPRA